MPPTPTSRPPPSMLLWVVRESAALISIQFIPNSFLVAHADFLGRVGCCRAAGLTHGARRLRRSATIRDVRPTDLHTLASLTFTAQASQRALACTRQWRSAPQCSHVAILAGRMPPPTHTHLSPRLLHSAVCTPNSLRCVTTFSASEWKMFRHG